MSTAYLKRTYLSKKKEITSRMDDFEKVKELGENSLLGELAFCISTANSSAKAAYRAQTELLKTGLIYSDNSEHIAEVLLKSKVRFHNNKAKYIVAARKQLFVNGEFEKYVNESKDEFELRDSLAESVMGFGMKEAAHFLRNTGYGKQTAILDRHILRNLKRYGAIEEIPKSLTPNKYREIEGKMLEFSKEMKIPPAHLDLVFWSEETGEIFK